MKIHLKRPLFVFVLIVIVVAVLNGCGTSSFRVTPDLPNRNPDTKVLLMPLDIELSTLTAGGLLKPEAEWTARAINHVETSIIQQMGQLKVGLITPAEAVNTALTPEEEEQKVQLTKLHEVVGQSIMFYQYVLPTKRNTFDWTLGPQTKLLKDKYKADYAMFVFMRDSYASGGRVAVALIAAMFGVSVQMGIQQGFASLVDLETGKVVWFNRLMRGVGDLRTPEFAAASVSTLLTDFPQ